MFFYLYSYTWKYDYLDPLEVNSILYEIFHFVFFSVNESDVDLILEKPLCFYDYLKIVLMVYLGKIVHDH